MDMAEEEEGATEVTMAVVEIGIRMAASSCKAVMFSWCSALLWSCENVFQECSMPCTRDWEVTCVVVTPLSVFDDTLVQAPCADYFGIN